MKKQLIMAFAVATMSLATGLGTHFGVSNSSVSNSNTNTVSNLRSATGNVNYEFDVLNVNVGKTTGSVNFGVQLLNSKNDLVKDYGNFKLKNSLNQPQQLIQLDNLSSSGTTIKIYDKDHSDNYININPSVAKATAYDQVTNAYYVGRINYTGGKSFNYYPNTADIVQTMSYIKTPDKQLGLMQFLFQSWVYAKGDQNPSPSDNYSNQAYTSGIGDFIKSYFTFVTPDNFKMLRTKDVEYYQGVLMIQTLVYEFSGVKKVLYKKPVVAPIQKAVDMTTLNGKAHSDKFYTGMETSLSGSTCYTVNYDSFEGVFSTVYFNN